MQPPLNVPASAEERARQLLGGTANPFMRWVEHRLMPPLMSMAESPIVVAIQDGVMSAIPAIVVGFLLYFLFPPERIVFRQSLDSMGPVVGGLFGAQIAHDPRTDLISRALEAFNAGLGCMSLWASFRVAWKLARLQERHGMRSGTLSLVLFSLTFPRPMFPLGLHDLFLYLAHGGLFVAILLAWLAAWLEGRLGSRFSPGRAALIAFLACGVGVEILNRVLMAYSTANHLADPVQIHTLVYLLFSPIMQAGDSPLVIVIILSMILLTTMGVHGTGVLGSMMLPIWFALLADNARAARDGLLIPHVVTPEFMHWCFLGGSGCTLPLCLFMLRARSTRLRKLGRISLLPSLCNVNETLTFGIPLIMNPLTVIPFVLCPVLLAAIHYVELKFNFWHRTIIYMPFVIPTPFTMWLASGGDWRAFPCFAVDFTLCASIWYPFFLTLDKKACETEAQTAEAGETVFSPAETTVS